MRKRPTTAVVTLVGLFVLILLALWWAAGPEEPAHVLEAGAEERGLGGRRALAPGEEGQERAAPGSTPLLEQAAAEAQGLLEVEALHQEQRVPGALVRLYRRGERDPNLNEIGWRLAGTAVTDAEGRARLPSAPGAYLLAVRAPGLAPLLLDLVRPLNEEHTRVQARLEPGHVLAGHTRLLGSAQPLPRVELILTPHRGQSVIWHEVLAPAEERVYSMSDERGHFRVEGLAAGVYKLEARAAGHGRVRRYVQIPTPGELTVELSASSFVEGFVVDEQGQPVAGAEVLLAGKEASTTMTGEGGGFSLEAEAGTYALSARKEQAAGALAEPVVVTVGRTVSGLQIKLGTGAELHGRVVQKSSGAPVAGAQVLVSPWGRNGDVARVVTDEQGTFSAPGLPAGGYDVVARAPGYVRAMRRGVMVSQGERFELTLELRGMGAVQGTVRDEADRPVAGALVTTDQFVSDMLGTTYTRALTDAEGRYRLTGLPVGSAYLMAYREGSAVAASALVEVTEGEPQEQDFVLAELGTVEGRVRTPLGSPPEEPLRLVMIREGLSGGQVPEVGPLGAEGRFIRKVPAGSYTLRVFPDGIDIRQLSSDVYVQVEAGRTSRVEVVLYEEVTDALYGLVLEPDGSPSAGAQVEARAKDGSVSRTVQTRADGRFQVPLPPEARGQLFELNAVNNGRMASLREVQAQGREVVLRLQSAGSVRGRVLRAGGVPAQGFRLHVRSPEGPWSPMGGLEPEFPGGHFELSGLPSGSLRIDAHSQGLFGSVTLRLGAGEQAEVEILLQPLCRLRGRVVNAITRVPVMGATIHADEALSDASPATTDEQGFFEMQGVLPGEQVLSIFGGNRGYARRKVLLRAGEERDLGEIALSRE